MLTFLWLSETIRFLREHWLVIPLGFNLCWIEYNSALGRTHYWIKKRKASSLYTALGYMLLISQNEITLSSVTFLPLGVFTQHQHHCSLPSTSLQVFHCTHKYWGSFNCCQSVSCLMNLLPKQCRVMVFKGSAPESQADLCKGGEGGEV